MIIDLATSPARLRHCLGDDIAGLWSTDECIGPATGLLLKWLVKKVIMPKEQK